MNKAQEHGLDLIEISPNAVPPIAKIMDFGKYQYEEAKKVKAAKSKSSAIELKSLQVKIGTGEHDLELKAKRASEWIKEGHRIKVDLFLSGRAKYMDFNFLKERMNRILALITEEYRIADGPSKGPKGVSIIIEKGTPRNPGEQLLRIDPKAAGAATAAFASATARANMPNPFAPQNGQNGSRPFGAAPSNQANPFAPAQKASLATPPPASAPAPKPAGIVTKAAPAADPKPATPQPEAPRAPRSFKIG